MLEYFDEHGRFWISLWFMVITAIVLMFIIGTVAQLIEKINHEEHVERMLMSGFTQELDFETNKIIWVKEKE